MHYKCAFFIVFGFDFMLHKMNKKDSNRLIRKKKIRNYFSRKFIRELKLFFITVLVAFLPFVFVIIKSFFNGSELNRILLTIRDFFTQSDMFIAIISVSVTAALVNIFTEKYKTNFATVLCWVVIFISALYFSYCDGNNVNADSKRTFGFFIIAILLSIINIFKQCNRENGD